MKILGISGSLRQESFNTKLFQNAKELLSEENSLEIFDISAIPLYNGELDGEEKPEAVTALKNTIEACDALLFASPEYNYSISGVLKNVIDWASRPAYQSVMAGKPAGIVSASGGPLGGARSQAQLRYVLAATLTPVFPEREYTVPNAGVAFDGNGQLKDDKMTGRLAAYLEKLVAWCAR